MELESNKIFFLNKFINSQLIHYPLYLNIISMIEKYFKDKKYEFNEVYNFIKEFFNKYCYTCNSLSAAFLPQNITNNLLLNDITFSDVLLKNIISKITYDSTVKNKYIFCKKIINNSIVYKVFSKCNILPTLISTNFLKNKIKKRKIILKQKNNIILEDYDNIFINNPIIINATYVNGFWTIVCQDKEIT